jgi:hypothetical protein
VSEYFICLVSGPLGNQSTQMRCSHHLNNGRGRKCKRNACDGTDFCKQHNPLNKLDDTTCAICLDDIKDPLKTGGCRHIFCKGCLARSALNNNILCPCCRGYLGVNTLSTCIEVMCGKQRAMQFELQIEIGLNQYKWNRPWSKDMQRRFRIAYPDQVM